MVVKITTNSCFTRPTYRQDYEFGKQKEGELLPLLLKAFPTLGKIESIKSRYSQFDYKASDGSFLELKSRNITSKAFSTTLLPVSKTINVDDEKQNVIYIFGFTDGYYYIHYNKNLFDTFEKKVIQRIRDDKFQLPASHYLIPVNSLLPL